MEKEIIEQVTPLIDQYILFNLKIKQLNDRGQLSFKELSIITEYHEEKQGLVDQIMKLLIDYRSPVVEEYIKLFKQVK